MKDILALAASLLALDAIGYAAWHLSGQSPVDGFYLGSITSHIIHLWI